MRAGDETNTQDWPAEGVALITTAALAPAARALIDAIRLAGERALRIRVEIHADESPRAGVCMRLGDLPDLHTRRPIRRALVMLPDDGTDIRVRVGAMLDKLRVPSVRLNDPRALIGEARSETRPRIGPANPLEGASERRARAYAELVGRSPRAIDRAAIAPVIEGKRVLITGAGGSIGGELARMVASLEPERLILIDRSENALFDVDRRLRERRPSLDRRAVLHDVVQADQTRSIVDEHRPHVVLHAAAHKHVPLMEDHPALAIENNLFGTKSIADAAFAAGAERFVMVSTDKAVEPTSVMGATKRLAELYVHDAARRAGAEGASVVRFGNVLGSACSVLTIWTAQLAEGVPITVTDPEMTRYFMTIPEAASLVIRSMAPALNPADAGTRTFVLDMGEPVRILDLAERFVRLHGLDPTIADARSPGAAHEGASIIITGARPGEKTHEALAYPQERLAPTSDDAITVWEATDDVSAIGACLPALDAARRTRDRDAALRELARAIPTLAAPVIEQIAA